MNNAQEEIKARLEVAQLYEEMGQLPKAARYYLNAAEIALKSKLFDRGRELLHKVLQLDPGNAQATTYLQKLDQHLASLGHAPPAAPSSQTAGASPAATPSAAAQPRAAAGSGQVTVPTPTLYLKSEQIAAILAQVSSAPNPKFFPYTPLPKIDPRAIEEKNKKMEALKEAERARERTAVESAFSSSGAGFTSGAGTSGFLNSVQRSGRRKKEEEADESAADKRRRRGGGNQDLADSIRKRLQGG